jgi:hypothetical protein
VVEESRVKIEFNVAFIAEKFDLATYTEVLF